MKKIILIVLVLLLAAVSILLGTNKTFLKDYYAIENRAGQEALIQTLKYSYFAGEPTEHQAVFYRLGNGDKMQSEINRYVEGLTSCYDDGAFSDRQQGFTIYSYQVSDGFLIHKITLTYDDVDLKEQEEAQGADLLALTLEDGDYTLQVGDQFFAALGEDAVLINGQDHGQKMTTGRGVSLGDEMDMVLSRYQIPSGKGLWEVESDKEGDGVIELTTKTFQGASLNSQEITKATLYVLYYKEESQWIPLSSDEVESYLAYLAGEGGQKPYDFLLLYRFEFDDLASVEDAAKGPLSSLEIQYRE